MYLENLGYEVIDSSFIWLKDKKKKKKVQLPYIKEQLIKSFNV